MATSVAFGEDSVAFGEDVEIPFVGSLSEFRQWALSEGFPERGRRHGATDFEPAPIDADGFQHSAVFQQWFRLTRRRDRRGSWAFDLERRDQRDPPGS